MLKVERLSTETAKFDLEVSQLGKVGLGPLLLRMAVHQFECSR
jgi:hypothetical protein